MDEYYQEDEHQPESLMTLVQLPGFDDLTNGEGKLYKKILTSGTVGTKPELGDEVSIRYSGSVLNLTDPDSDAAKEFVTDKKRVFRLGIGAVMPALEVAVFSMLENETSEVHCIDLLGYGEIPLRTRLSNDNPATPPSSNDKQARPSSSNDNPERPSSSNDKQASPSSQKVTQTSHELVPANSGLKLTVTLVKRTSKSQAISTFTTAEILSEMVKCKSYGNIFFSEEQYYRAGTMYSKGINLLEFVKDPLPAQQRQCAELLISYGNNMANTLMKMGEYKQAGERCLEVLEIDPNNIKALYRMGLSALELDRVDESLTYLIKAAKQEPKNTLVRDALNRVKIRREEMKVLEAEAETIQDQWYHSYKTNRMREAKENDRAVFDHDTENDMTFALAPVEMTWTNYDFVSLSVLVAILALCLYVVLGMN